MEAYFVRDYNANDYDEVIRIWKSTGMGGEERGDNEKTIDDSLKIGGRFLLLIEKETSQIIGTSWMTFDGRRILLHHFGIDPAFQGRGLSRILMRESMKHVKDKGYQVKLEVHQSNKRAIFLYKSYGFKYLGDYEIYIIRDVSKI